MKQVPLIDDGHAAKLERDREHEVDRTPPMVCLQGLTWAVHTIPERGRKVPRTMIDIGAGSGVFGQQLAVVHEQDDSMFEDFDTPDAGLCRIAIEPRIEEAPHLRRHYEFVRLTTFGQYLSYLARDAWVACNPAFSIFPEIVRHCVPVCTAVLLYGSIAWGCSEAGAELFSEFKPYACARVVGRVHHRGPGLNPNTGQPWGADQRDNCFWLWLRDHQPRTWTTENLPMLPSEQRRWQVPPGSEM